MNCYKSSELNWEQAVFKKNYIRYLVNHIRYLQFIENKKVRKAVFGGEILQP